MDNFAFMIHPIEPQRDVARKFPLLGRLPPGVIDFFSSLFPPVLLSHVVGIRSVETGREIEGWLVACPMTPKRMLEVSLDTAYRKVVQTGRLAERLGARILGLGAFTAVVGDAGRTVSQSLSIPVTTGNSYTVAVAIEASMEAARRMGLEPARSVFAVVGASGSTGRACAQMLAGEVESLILSGRNMDRLMEVREQVESLGARATATTRLGDIREADAVLCMTSSIDPIVQPEFLKPGTVVCDVARPRSVSRRVADERDDVLVIEGGVVEVPGEVSFGFDFGFPPRQVYACMAETMLLALEGRYECFSIGREISLDRVDEIAQLGRKHGFRLSGFRSFERVIDESEIDKIRERAHERQHSGG
jgi:fatty aldehyde-generating acyl-ACP reductase